MANPPTKAGGSVVQNSGRSRLRGLERANQASRECPIHAKTRFGMPVDGLFQQVLKGDLVLWGSRTFAPEIERLAQSRLHFRGIKISHDAEDHVIGMHVLFVPAHQVLAF